MKHFERIRETMVLILGISPNQITPQTSREDLAEWDSMGNLNLMLALEEQFGVSFTVDEMSGMRNIDSLNRLLEDKCTSR